jgi:hypothetical protein
MAEQIPTEFVNYLRAYPMVIKSHALSEKAKLQAAPETAAWFANKGITDPAEQQRRISNQAWMNGRQNAMAELAAKRQQYGVKTLTPDTLRAALERESADYTPSAKVTAASGGGDDPATTYATKVAPDIVNSQLARLSVFTPFDQPQQATQQQKIAQGLRASRDQAAASPSRVLQAIQAARQPQQQAPVPAAIQAPIQAPVNPGPSATMLPPTQVPQEETTDGS